MENYIQGILNSLIYCFIGIVLLLASYFVIEKITPEKSWKEIVENKNHALAIIFSALIIGISMIISAAIHG
ncbi:MAG: DUF350 domain-containing protein [Flavobacteriia bacterium]|nr:DUF350 domain-containing protein [Flavobacteriia bacterium]OJX37199.1 MAG: hypothetical protein BGO87_14740 [Flavobacteriia bacterium 40-80]